MKDNLSILICGEAGQGIQTVESLLTKIFKASGLNVFATKEYMSRIRGGSNSIEIRISSSAVRAPVYYPDIVVLLDKNAYSHIEKRVSPSTLIFADQTVTGPLPGAFSNISFSKEAEAIGNKIYANVIAVGLLSRLVDIAQDEALECLRRHFIGKSSDSAAKNIEAIKRGYEFAGDLLLSDGGLKDWGLIKKDKADLEKQIISNGAESIALGALAGGCNFVSSYPMSPSTGVLVFLSQQAASFNLITEQAEDEISAINMVIGAWYAGGRGLVTTSGGGFALMGEGVSLSAMTETPIVVHIAQRPGPATGLPTRTEQGDLELVLYSGHGEFPRAIFAPGSLEDAFFCTQKAFYIADRYQIPVFILTDQYLMDTYYNSLPFKIVEENYKNQIVKTNKSYQRYCLTETGISPRGVPGYGEGLVRLDSDEHDESGCITESMKVRTQMVEKRLKKQALVVKDIIAPQLIGNPAYSTLLISWGSTFHIVKEAYERLNRDNIALLHFSQLFPLSEAVIDYFKKAKKTVIIENNATAQFAKLIRLHTGIKLDEKILKYDGLPFFVDELEGLLKKVV